MSQPVQFGLCLPQETADIAVLRDIAHAAENLGFHSLWVHDHFYRFPTRQTTDFLEAWTVLSVLAGMTSSIRLGTLVLCHGYRSPALLAKMAATLDVLSEGRLDLGLGIGGSAAEAAGYGYDVATVGTRLRQLDEAVRVMRQLWQADPVSFAGEFYQLREAICAPAPRQQPGPPITIGGGGEQHLLRVVAQHADVWNYFAVPLPEYERKVQVLAEHCQAVGRDPDTIERSLYTPTITADWEKTVRDRLDAVKAQGYLWAEYGNVVQGTPDIVVPRYRDYMRRGVRTFIVQLADPRDVSELEFFANEIMRELED